MKNALTFREGGIEGVLIFRCARAWAARVSRIRGSRGRDIWKAGDPAERSALTGLARAALIRVANADSYVVQKWPPSASGQVRSAQVRLGQARSGEKNKKFPLVLWPALVSACGGSRLRLPKIIQGYSRLSKPIQAFCGKKDCLFFGKGRDGGQGTDSPYLFFVALVDSNPRNLRLQTLPAKCRPNGRVN
jgi:hypothetical protein